MGRDFSDPVGQRGHWTARYCSGGCGRLWLNDGSCVRLRPERPNHVWSYDFSWTCKNWPGDRAFEGWKPMARHRTHTIEFKRQAAQEFLGGEVIDAPNSAWQVRTG
jgi:hypothetical protein